MFLRVELLGQYSDSVLASGKLSGWFSQKLRHCTFPSAGQEDSSSSTSLPTLVDNICLFIIAILSSKGLYAQRSNAKTFSGIGFITFACHALPCLVFPLQVSELSPGYPLSFYGTVRIAQSGVAFLLSFCFPEECAYAPEVWLWGRSLSPTLSRCSCCC